MWEKATMSMFEALMISLSGICIVFIVLLVIAGMIKITSIVVSSIVKEEKKEMPKKAAPVDKGISGDTIAAIIAAVSEDMRVPVDRFEIKSIKEKK